MAPIKITPCSENWDNFTPTKLGRTCQACATEVIDFTQMNDAQIKSFFKTMAGEKFCGHFKASQLDPSVFDEANWQRQSPQNLSSKFLLALMVGFGLSLFSCSDPDRLKAIQTIAQSNIEVSDTTKRPPVQTKGNQQNHPNKPFTQRPIIEHTPTNNTALTVDVITQSVTVNSTYVKDSDRTFTGVPPIQESRDDIIRLSSIKNRLKLRFSRPIFKVNTKKLVKKDQLNIKLKIKQPAFFYIQILTRDHLYIRTVDQVYIEDDHYSITADIADLTPGKYTLRITSETQIKDIKFKKK